MLLNQKLAKLCQWSWILAVRSSDETEWRWPGLTTKMWDVSTEVNVSKKKVLPLKVPLEIL